MVRMATNGHVAKQSGGRLVTGIAPSFSEKSLVDLHFGNYMKSQ